nr:hypothetical protein CFP56_68961 [Quercus suber]
MVSDARAIEGGDGRIAGFSRLLGGLSPQFRSSNSIRTLCCDRVETGFIHYGPSRPLPTSLFTPSRNITGNYSRYASI